MVREREKTISAEVWLLVQCVFSRADFMVVSVRAVARVSATAVRVAIIRAALETFGLVHEHKKGMPFTSHVRRQNLVKKAALRTVGGGAHHDGRGACRPRGGR